MKVLVTTQHRGVFFGEMENGAMPESLPQSLTLRNARNCLYWSADTLGFLGLATSGPGSGCRVGPAAPRLTLYDVTSIAEVTPEAAEKWEAGPWN